MLVEQVLYRTVLHSSISLSFILESISDSLFSFGTELISPDDLLRACSLWEKFNVYVQNNRAFYFVGFSSRS